MIHLDTSVLIDSLTGPRRSAPALRRTIDRGERILFSTIVLYEWLRGQRSAAELNAQEGLFPRRQPCRLARMKPASRLIFYRAITRGRGREIDLAIAAIAMAQNASLWTLNIEDFRDIDGLTLYDASE